MYLAVFRMAITFYYVIEKANNNKSKPNSLFEYAFECVCAFTTDKLAIYTEKNNCWHRCCVCCVSIENPIRKHSTDFSAVNGGPWFAVVVDPNTKMAAVK